MRQKPDRTALKALSSGIKASSVTRFGLNHTAMIYGIAEETREFFSALRRIAKQVTYIQRFTKTRYFGRVARQRFLILKYANSERRFVRIIQQLIDPQKAT